MSKKGTRDKVDAVADALVDAGAAGDRAANDMDSTGRAFRGLAAIADELTLHHTLDRRVRDLPLLREHLNALAIVVEELMAREEAIEGVTS